MNIYQLTGEYLALYDRLMTEADEETGEASVDVLQAFNAIEGEVKDKAIAYACVERGLEDYKARITAEIARLTAIKKRVDKNIDRIKETLTTACNACGIEKLEGMHSSISFRTSEETVIDDLLLLPDEYTKIERKADKAAIKEAIKRGEEVLGAHIEKKRNIQIK